MNDSITITPAAAAGGDSVDEVCHGHHYSRGRHRSAGQCRGQRSTASQRGAP